MWLSEDRWSPDWGRFAERHQLPYLVPTQSGTQALEIAIQLKLSFEPKRTNPLRISGLNCEAVTEQASRADGAIQLFAPAPGDLVTPSLHVPPDSKGLTEVAVHLGATRAHSGWRQGSDAIVVEDCCQAPETFHLASQRGAGPHVAAFSLGSGKPYSAGTTQAGTAGGFIATNERELADAAQRLLTGEKSCALELPTLITRRGWRPEHLAALREGTEGMPNLSSMIGADTELAFFVGFVAESQSAAEWLWIALSCEGYPVRLSHMKPELIPEERWIAPGQRDLCAGLSQRLLLLFAEAVPGKSIDEFCRALERVVDRLDEYQGACYPFTASETPHMLRKDSRGAWRLTRRGSSEAQVLTESAAQELIRRLSGADHA